MRQFLWSGYLPWSLLFLHLCPPSFSLVFLLSPADSSSSGWLTDSNSQGNSCAHQLPILPKQFSLKFLINYHQPQNLLLGNFLMCFICEMLSEKYLELKKSNKKVLYFGKWLNRVSKLWPPFHQSPLTVTGRASFPSSPAGSMQCRIGVNVC